MLYCSKCNQPIIEKGATIPGRVRGKYDFVEQMDVGDSVLTKTEKDYDAVRHAFRHRKIPSRSTKMSDGSGWRVWRIAIDTKDNPV